jgi:hypothetical protein
MWTDQVEILAREKNHSFGSHPRDVQRLLNAIRVKRRPERRQGKKTLDKVAQEAEDLTPPEEKHSTRTLLLTLTWAGVVFALTSLSLVFWAIAVHFLG